MGTRRSSRTRRPALQGDRVCEGSCRCRQGPEAVFCPFPGKATSALGHTDLNTRSTPTPTAHCRERPLPVRGGREKGRLAEREEERGGAGEEGSLWG